MPVIESFIKSKNMWPPLSFMKAFGLVKEHFYIPPNLVRSAHTAHIIESEIISPGIIYDKFGPNSLIYYELLSTIFTYFINNLLLLMFFGTFNFMVYGSCCDKKIIFIPTDRIPTHTTLISLSDLLDHKNGS